MTDVVGLDPSLTSTGIAVHSPGVETLLHTVASKGKKGASWIERHARLCTLREQIVDRIPSSSVVFMESPSYSSTSTSSHDRSGLWWHLYDGLHLRGCVIVPVSPAQRMMYATSKGNSAKDAVMAAAIRRYSRLDIKNNDEADAVILMALGLRALGRPIEDSLPQSHLRALDKLELPPHIREIKNG